MNIIYRFVCVCGLSCITQVPSVRVKIKVAFIHSTLPEQLPAGPARVSTILLRALAGSYKKKTPPIGKGTMSIQIKYIHMPEPLTHLFARHFSLAVGGRLYLPIGAGQ